MKRSLPLFALFAVAALSTGLLAQAPGPPAPAAPPQQTYKLHVVLQELGGSGKVTNARSYDTMISTGAGPFGQQIKAGDRIPVATGAENGSTQIQYIDVGVSLEVQSVRQTDNKLGFRLRAEISTLANQGNAKPEATLGDPVVRENKWDSAVLIPIGKATVVYSSDDLQGTGKTQVEVTATPVD